MSERISGPRPTSTVRRRSCPICRRPADLRFQPFCSKRCADIDLGRWLGETYRIPATESEADEEDTTEDGSIR